jgi:DNA-binding XRE family transcriptional regulator
MKLTLKACRTNVKATAKELAEYVGVTEDTIYNWECGKYCPTAVKMQKILEFYERKGFVISLNDIIFLP